MAPELQLHLTLLILLSACLHATWNALLKSGGDPVLTFTILRIIGFTSGFIGIWFVPLPEPAAWPFLVSTGIIHTCYYTLLVTSYRYGDLSLVYPIARGGAPLLVALMAAWTLGEVPATEQLIGIALISAGILGLSFARGLPRGADGKAVVLAALTAVTVAAYTINDGQGARVACDTFSYIVWLHIFEGPPFLLWALYTRRGRIVDYFVLHWGRGLISGVLSMVGYGLAIYALTQGAMAHVAALRETSVLFAALIGTFLLKETLGPRRLIAAAVIVAGIVLLQFG